MGYLNCELGFGGKKVVFKSKVGGGHCQLKNAIKHTNYKHELYWDSGAFSFLWGMKYTLK